MLEQLKKAIFQGNYYDAKVLCRGGSFDEIEDFLMALAYETESMAIFDFAQFMWRATKEISWLDVIVGLLLNPLCHIEGAYSTALFYAKELLKYCCTVENLEQVLFFSELPEKVLAEEEARAIAQQILIQDPENETALHYLQDK